MLLEMKQGVPDTGVWLTSVLFLVEYTVLYWIF